MYAAPLEQLRGDYAGMASDWTVQQRAESYSDEEQAVWRLLVERQSALARRYACREFMEGLETLGIGDTIPDFAEGRFDSPLFRKIAVCFVLFIGFFLKN